MVNEINNSREFGYLISSMAAVCLDVLFLYIYYIDEEKKCFAMDKKIKNAAIVLRSVTDFILLLHVILQLSGAQKVPRMNLLIDFLSLLPIPQIMILVLFANMKSTMYLQNRWRMMLLPLYQYVPRVIRIYLLCKQLSRSSTPDDITGTAWVRGTFNFFLFILASHVVGAFWYCFSVERELHCWQRACKYNSGCRATTFFCDDITGYERFVDEFCPINPPDPVKFDFGIFLDAYQSGVSRVTDFPVKLLYCFFWGLRALSSFGSNLKTSSYSCENMFAASVSIAGILLVVYLIGNLQVYLQSSPSRSEEKRRMMQDKEASRSEEKQRMMENKGAEINSWIEYYQVQDKQKDIMDYVRDKFDGKNDVNLKTLFDVFPPTFANEIKKRLCFPILRNVPSLEYAGEHRLAEITERLKPVVFAEQSYIVREGEPVELMLLFTRGIGLAYSSRREEGGAGAGILQRGNFFGEQLLDWTPANLAEVEIPLSERTVRVQIQMEAFALTVVDFCLNPPMPVLAQQIVVQ